MFLTPTADDIWQGRDDTHEAEDALRLFQTITNSKTFSPQEFAHNIGLIGFACDEGVKRNKGRSGAHLGPDYLRKALAGMASHQHHFVDFGTINARDNNLENAQQALINTVNECQRSNVRTLVFGGGHETAYAHGMGLYQAVAGKKVAIINFDAHLDLRCASQPTSGTPFLQLAHYCQSVGQPFDYTCIGASLAANTQTLVATAADLGSKIFWDTDCQVDAQDTIYQHIQDTIARVECVYMTIDLDVLPAYQMPAVSAPAAMGIPLAQLLALIYPICHSGKLYAADLVELNPLYDIQGLSGKVAARIAWQIIKDWQYSA